MKSKTAPNKKRHHYVPVSYLARFADEAGQLYAYRKDEPGKPFRSRPEGVGFQTYYYSQPLPDGGYDHNRLENGLAELEADWSDLAARIAAGENVNNRKDLQYLLGFVGLQRVRVPAARDLAERALAYHVKQEILRLDGEGLLPEKPEGLENILDLIDVTIDPQKSLESIPTTLRHLGPILDSIGYRIIHNETGLSFITSDNPVSYFDPSLPEQLIQPYRVHLPYRPMELLFPIDPHTMLHGHSGHRNDFIRGELKHVRVRDVAEIKRLNRLTARFAYELIISKDAQHAPLVRAYADSSPVLDVSGDEPKFVFGSRTKKPKWERPQAEAFQEGKNLGD